MSDKHTAINQMRLDPTMRSGDAVQFVLHTLFMEMKANEPGIRNDRDIEYLHDYRVALRRSRTVLGQMKSVLPKEPVCHLQHELKWISEITGPARDLDVYLAQLKPGSGCIPATLETNLEPLYFFLQNRREIVYSRILELLDSDRYVKFTKEWDAFLTTHGMTDDQLVSNQPIRQTASKQIWQIYRRIRKRASRIRPESPDSDLHKLRILCKKLRYMLEIFSALFPKRKVDRLLRAIKDLQNNLGVYQDCVVQRKMLSALAHDMVDESLIEVDTIFAMGQLSAVLENRQNRTRDTFVRSFTQFSRPSNRHDFKKLFKS